MAFQKAERKRAKARVALAGPSGSGKSMSALLLAKGLMPEGKIAAIDTEHGSLSLYSHVLDFDVCELSPPYRPERYIDLIHEAEKAGYDLILIDSLTHEWQGAGGLLEDHETIAKKIGNSFSAWAQITPRHQALIDAMLQSPCHIIATIRSKTEYIQSSGNDGKTKIQKAGMAPQQRDGIDYEFTVVFDLSIDHIANAHKDRTSIFDGCYGVITEEHGKTLQTWLASGQPVKESPQPSQADPADALPPADDKDARAKRKLIVQAIQAYWQKVPITAPIAQYNDMRTVLTHLPATATPPRAIGETWLNASLDDLDAYRKALKARTQGGE